MKRAVPVRTILDEEEEKDKADAWQNQRKRIKEKHRNDFEENIYNPKDAILITNLTK